MRRTKQAAPMTIPDALNALSSWHHSFVSEESANKVARVLGIRKPVPCYPGQSDRTGDPKGLTMHSGMEGSRGVAGWHLAQWICDALNLNYERKIGRGFQTQACAEALRLHFRITEK